MFLPDADKKYFQDRRTARSRVLDVEDCGDDYYDDDDDEYEPVPAPKDGKRYLQVARVARDGLVVVERQLPSSLKVEQKQGCERLQQIKKQNEEARYSGVEPGSHPRHPNPLDRARERRRARLEAERLQAELMQISAVCFCGECE